MGKWAVAALVVLLGMGAVGLWLAGMGGGEGGTVAGESGEARVGAGAQVAGVVTAAPTATPWPTFTPLPTASPTPVPPTMMPTVVWPTFTPVPTKTALPGVSGTVEPTATPDVRLPTPTPYGQYPGKEVFFLQQSLFPLQVGEFPDYVLEARWDDLPAAYDVISSRARFVAWVVMFDASKIGEGEEIKGVVRWMDVTPGWPEMIMLETEVVLEREKSVFYVALGNVRLGIWKTGFYRVVFLDQRLEEVVAWDFEVR